MNPQAGMSSPTRVRDGKIEVSVVTVIALEVVLRAAWFDNGPMSVTVTPSFALSEDAPDPVAPDSV